MCNIIVLPSNSDLQEKATILAKKLNLSMRLSPLPTDQYALTLTPEYLGLIKINSAMAPLIVDFLAPSLCFRQSQMAVKKELLLKALGLKKEYPQTTSIIDATGGLGRDSSIIAHYGFKVCMLERSAIIYALLEDAFARAKQADLKICHQIKVIHTDAIAYLASLPPVDIVYLDPMFPEKRKSALPKKDMRFMQDIVGEDLDAVMLWRKAIACAGKRVVVKRPRLADYLAHTAPSYSLEGKSCRFDIYLT